MILSQSRETICIAYNTRICIGTSILDLTDSIACAYIAENRRNAMSEFGPMSADLLIKDCAADDKYFEMLFRSARNAVGKIDHDNAAEVPRDAEAERDFADKGVIHRPSSLCGRLGWGAQMMFRRPVNVCKVNGRMFFGVLRRDAKPAAVYTLSLVPLLTDRQPELRTWSSGSGLDRDLRCAALLGLPTSPPANSPGVVKRSYRASLLSMAKGRVTQAGEAGSSTGRAPSLSPMSCNLE
jgi:hypothetical protein